MAKAKIFEKDLGRGISIPELRDEQGDEPGFLIDEGDDFVKVRLPNGMDKTIRKGEYPDQVFENLQTLPQHPDYMKNVEARFAPQPQTETQPVAQAGTAAQAAPFATGIFATPEPAPEQQTTVEVTRSGPTSGAQQKLQSLYYKAGKTGKEQKSAADALIEANRKFTGKQEEQALASQKLGEQVAEQEAYYAGEKQDAATAYNAALQESERRTAENWKAFKTELDAAKLAYEKMPEASQGAVWQSKSAGNLFGAAIAMAVGAIGETLAGKGGQHNAVKIILRGVDQEVEARMRAKQEAYRKIRDVKEGYQENAQHEASLRAQANAHRLAVLNMIDVQVDKIHAIAKSQDVKNKAIGLKEALGVKLAEAENNIKTAIGDRERAVLGLQAGIAGQMATEERARLAASAPGQKMKESTKLKIADEQAVLNMIDGLDRQFSQMEENSLFGNFMWRYVTENIPKAPTEAKAYNDKKKFLAEHMLRKWTGAAAPEHEVVKVAGLMPDATDTSGRAAQKMEALRWYFLMRRDSMMAATGMVDVSRAPGAKQEKLPSQQSFVGQP